MIQCLWLPSGCGEWKRPNKRNPDYKGKWVPELIDNPKYSGVWAPRRIANPDYFEDKQPYKMVPIVSVTNNLAATLLCVARIGLFISGGFCERESGSALP